MQLESAFGARESFGGALTNFHPPDIVRLGCAVSAGSTGTVSFVGWHMATDTFSRLCGLTTRTVILPIAVFGSTGRRGELVWQGGSTGRQPALTSITRYA